MSNIKCQTTQGRRSRPWLSSSEDRRSPFPQSGPGGARIHVSESSARRYTVSATDPHEASQLFLPGNKKARRRWRRRAIKSLDFSQSGSPVLPRIDRKRHGFGQSAAIVSQVVFELQTLHSEIPKKPGECLLPTGERSGLAERGSRLFSSVGERSDARRLRFIPCW